MTVRYLSVCSGIEAASVAWHHLGWTPVAFSEVDPFPCAVLQHHYPDVPNWGDMRKWREWPDEKIDLLVGGTPCQSFSVAGLRKGLDDPRGGLMLDYVNIARRYRPRWVVWENVPGVLTSNGGRDFGTLLGALGDLGYQLAYRVLDAQWIRTQQFPHAVPQRRRRVFVVGYLGERNRAAEVLFVGESVRRDTTPSRRTVQNPASGPGESTPSGGREGGDGEGDPDPGRPVAVSEVAGTLACNTGPNGHDAGNFACNQAVDAGHLVPTVFVKSTCPHSSDEAPTFLQTNVAYTLTAWDEHRVPPKHMAVDIRNGVITGEVTQTLQSHHRSASLNSQPAVLQSEVVEAVAVQDVRGIEKRQNGRGWNDDGSSYTVDTHATQGVAFTCSSQANSYAWEREVNPTITAQVPSDTSNIQTGVRIDLLVRRLLPSEAESLQGFPLGYTEVPHKGKPPSDNLRYKALGNSMAVNCMAWLGQRIRAAE